MSRAMRLSKVFFGFLILARTLALQSLGFPAFQGKGHSRLRGKPAQAEATLANQPAHQFAHGRHPGRRDQP